MRYIICGHVVIFYSVIYSGASYRDDAVDYENRIVRNGGIFLLSTLKLRKPTIVEIFRRWAPSGSYGEVYKLERSDGELIHQIVLRSAHAYRYRTNPMLLLGGCPLATPTEKPIALVYASIAERFPNITRRGGPGAI